MMRHQIKRAGKLKPKKPIAWLLTNFDLWMTRQARLAQSVERKALNLVVVGSSPTVGVLLCVGFAVAAFRALSGYFCGGSGIVCMLTAFTGNA